MDASQANQATPNWIPFYSELIWPVFVLLLVFLFRGHVSAAFRQILAAIGEGRSVQVGEWLKIGEKTSINELESTGAGVEFDTLDVSLDTLGIDYSAADKGGASKLQQLRGRLQSQPGRRFNSLVVNNEMRFAVDMVIQYISQLGVRYVVFVKDGVFDGWVDAGVMVTQLQREGGLVDYDRLRNEVSGISDEKVNKDENALAILKKMEEMNIESLAVVDDGDQFKYMVNRVDILSKLMTRSLVTNQGQ